MEVYVVLYDVEGIFLLAKKRLLSGWRDGAPTKRVSVVKDPMHYCLLSGEQRPSETYFTAAKRVFADHTGYKLSEDQPCRYHYAKNGYAVVCFEVTSIRGFHRKITAGLAPSHAHSTRPVNTAIVNWDLDFVVMSKRDTLDFFLCGPQTNEEMWEVDMGLQLKGQGRGRYKEIISFLQTVR